ncbi:PAS domain-containing protein [Streptomyces sp. NPDC093252]|uniref:PAS domain-containing protein n=1 Tax=Streptomyces sp. NPDC093252 TaxID=3154980 RepID=UPI003434DA67
MSSRPSRGAARLAAILDALPDALVLVNANGTVVNANTIALEAFEAPGTALVGRGLLDLLPQFDSKLIPGGMRRPDHIDPRARTKPTRMIARRTDGTEFPVEVTSANLENAQQAYDGYGYTSAADELLMLVVRDLSGTVDTEAELARSQRQTEMILRAAAEGVVGTDTDGRIVLVNPAAAQILGYRAGELGGKELHTLVLHSRPDGSPFPYDESPLADTLRSGRKHRVRGQVLWSKAGEKVSVDLTTAPVRDGDQLVGAVMAFTDRRPYDSLAAEKDGVEQRHAEELERLSEEHASDLTALRQRHVTEVEELREAHAEELAAGEDRYAALAEREKDRYEALSGRHEQLLTLLATSLRGPLDELRRDLAALAADDAGQLWPEANQVLHHLSAGYSRITTLIDNVLGYQRLDAGTESVARTKVMLDSVVAAGVDGAVELIGPGRVQFAVHAPPIEAEVDPALLATALAHLVADVAGVDATGNSPVSAGGYMDNTVVVAAAQRGEVVRIEVRGPYAGGDPVHEPIVRGIVRAHGGVLQTHDVPGMSGSAFVLEVPIGGGAGAVAAAAVPGAGVAVPGAGAGAVVPGGGEEHPDDGAEHASGGGRRRARRSSVDAFLDSEVAGAAAGGGAGEGDRPAPTGRRRRRAVEEQQEQQGEQGEQGQQVQPGQQVGAVVRQAPAGQGGQQGVRGAVGAIEGPAPTGRRRGRPAEVSPQGVAPASPLAPVPPVAAIEPVAAQGSVVTAAEHAAGAAASRSGLGAAVPPQGVPAGPAGQLARQGGGQPAAALPPALPAPGSASGAGSGSGSGPGGAESGGEGGEESSGRRRRALAAAQERAVAQEAAPRTVFALPPAEADREAEAPRQRPVAAGGVTVPAATAMPMSPAVPVPVPAQGVPDGRGRHDAVPHPHDQGEDHTPPQPHPAGAPDGNPTGRRRRAVAPPAIEPMEPMAGVAAGEGAGAGMGVEAPQGVGAGYGVAGQGVPVPGQGIPVSGQGMSGPGQGIPAQAVAPGAAPGAAPGVTPGTAPGATPGGVAPVPAQGIPGPGVPAPGVPGQQSAPAQPHPQLQAQGQGQGHSHARSQPQPAPTPASGTPLPPEAPAQARPAQPLPAEAAGPAPAVPVDPDSTQGRAISVRTLGQGVPFTRQAGQVQQPPPQGGGGATPAPHNPSGSGRRRKLGTRNEGAGAAAPEQQARQHPPAEPAVPSPVPRPAQPSEGIGRSYAIGAPDENAAEGPEPLDGPGGAVEVPDPPRPQPMDDELPPEPLDNPRRLLVWPAPDVSTQQALSDRGYRPVIVHSREEVDAQIAAFPAALFVDPLTGPITRTALQSLRTAAVAAEVPVMVTAGLGQATREAAYGADPAVLLKALAPRDSEQHPPRVLLIEEHAEIALALTATLERRQMQVARAASDADAVALAGQFRPNLVVMDLMQVHRRQAGIVDWLRANGQLNRTPLVVYTAAVDQADLPRLASGETVLFLAERSTSTEVQSRIVDLLARIGTN